MYGLIPDTRLNLPHWERPYTGPGIPLSYKAQTEEPYFPEQVYLPPPTALIISCTSSFKSFSLKLAEMTEMAVMAKGVGKSDTSRIWQNMAEKGRNGQEMAEMAECYQRWAE